MQLVVLAAGMGSRFGGLKQMEPMDEFNNFLLDYSVHDAKKAGFDSVVFVIKKDFYKEFKESIGERVGRYIKVDYAFQDLNDLPEGFNCPEGRVKPWGTAHAIYAAREFIKDDFIIINGDDYYGQETYQVAYDYLCNAKESEYANVAFNVRNTMTENGSVKRGVIFANKDGYLEKMVESVIEKNDKGEIQCTPLEGGESFIVGDDGLVSMNLFAFTKGFIGELSKKFPLWIKDNINDLKAEFLIPSVVDELVHEGKATVKVLKTPSQWFGVTYKEDKPLVVKALAELVAKGLYKKGLH